MNEGPPIPIEETLTKDEFDQQWVKDKTQRHMDNVQKFTGFWHGTYFRDGMTAEPPKVTSLPPQPVES